MTETPHSDRDPLKVVVVIGSTRPQRIGRIVADWFVGKAARRDDMTVHVVDLAEAALPVVLTGDLAPDDADALAQVTPQLDAADAFVIVTPEYNHSFPASIKNLIDWHYTQWRAKPVAFVSYGGLAGGLRAVEHLRQVLAELHAVTVRDTVSFHGVAGRFDDAGTLIDTEGAAGAAKTMLDQLDWWARSLREARSVRPYAA
ncbi:NADPH-dependent FMN reductase [Herbihabitans rhizosphaerae]|nr:NAD(P)H-dependent oxidoreductase [Herbihabitans rhizosphaerae]